MGDPTGPGNQEDSEMIPALVQSEVKGGHAQYKQVAQILSTAPMILTYGGEFITVIQTVL